MLDNIAVSFCLILAGMAFMCLLVADIPGAIALALLSAAWGALAFHRESRRSK